MARIALVTCERWPELSESDRLYATALGAHGIDAYGVPWNGPPEAFEGADAIILRSNWDYHYHLSEFEAWLDARASSGVPLFNPAALVRWNLHKRYLLDLAAAGIAVPKTRLVPRDAVAVERALAELGGGRAVLKPAAGASGHNVRLIDAATARSVVAALDPSGHDAALLIQEFVPEIQDGGELAFVFFDGDFSHAFWRRPAPGEFRVNSQYQGRTERAEPEAAAVAQARSVLDALPERPLYARVDGVLRDGRFILMELELNEPGLALTLDEPSAGRFAAATARRLQATPSVSR